MTEQKTGGYPFNMFGGITQWSHPPPNPMASNSDCQPISYPNGGWNNNSNRACPGAENSGYGFQIKPTGWIQDPNQSSWNSHPGQSSQNNLPDQGAWNNHPSQGSWNNQPIQGSWSSQPYQGSWNNQPSQGSWNKEPSQSSCSNPADQSSWSAQSNQGSWNMGNRGGPMMRGTPPRGGRPMRARGFGLGGRFSGSARPQVPQSGDHYCDSCERGFTTADDLLHHRENDHIVCGLEGCTLSAHPKIVEKHQRMQHESGLYSRLAAASSQNPEDVQKWINERKKNYPTKENIELRKQAAEECMKRGESLSFRRGSRFGRPRGGMKHRGRGGHKIGESGQSWQDKGSHRGRGFGRGMQKRKFDGRGGRHQRQTRGRRVKKMPADQTLGSGDDDEAKPIPAFPGTAYLLGLPVDKTPSSDEEVEDETVSFSDSEWMEEKEEDGDSSVVRKKGDGVDDTEGKEEPTTHSNAIVLTNALGALMGTYASDDSDEDDAPVQKKIEVSKGNVLSDDKPKVEEQAVNKNVTQSENSTVTLSEKPSTLEVDGAPEVVVEQDQGEEGEESDGSAPEVVPIVKVSTDMNGSEEVVEGQERPQVEKEKGEEGGGSKRKRVRKRTRGKGSMEAAKVEGESPPKEKPSVIDLKRKREQMAYVKPPRHPTLLEELLKNEIRHERNVILQCIRYVVEKNFFDPKPVEPLEEENSTTSEEVVKSLPMKVDSTAVAGEISTEKCNEIKG